MRRRRRRRRAIYGQPSRPHTAKKTLGLPDAGAWIPHSDPVLGANIGDFYGSLVDLYSVGTTLVLEKPIFDGERGRVRIFTIYDECKRMEGEKGLW